MARIYSRPAKGKTIYYVDYLVHGRRVRKRIGTQKRVAEYALANWEDIDLQRKIISVSPKENWHPKDYEVRHIPINGLVYRLIF